MTEVFFLSPDLKMKLDSMTDREFVYLAYVGEFHGKPTIKYGSTKDIIQRIQAHRSHFKIFVLLHIEPSHSSRQLEKDFERHPNILPFIHHICVKDQIHIETIALRDGMTSVKCVKILKSLRNDSVSETRIASDQTLTDITTIEGEPEGQLDVDQLMRNYLTTYYVQVAPTKLNKYPIISAKILEHFYQVYPTTVSANMRGILNAAGRALNIKADRHLGPNRCQRGFIGLVRKPEMIGDFCNKRS